MTKPLTAAAVAKYRPGPRRRRIRDSGARSLFLIVETSGHKSWQMRFRRPDDGRPAKLTLGPVDLSGHELEGDPEIGMPLTLAAARALAASIHRQRAQGKDVIGDHKAARHRQRAALQEKNGNTFAQAARDYFAHYRLPKSGQRPRRWRETARVLGLDYADEANAKTIDGGLVEKWGDRNVRNIDDHDVWSIVQDAKERGIPGLEARNRNRSEARARHLFTALSGMFNWLRKERRVAANPCREMERPAAGIKRDRHLDSSEIRHFWQAAESVGEPFGTIFKLLLLTGQRLREVSGMRWSELSEDGVWNLPASRTKNGRPHTVPLPAAARELIAVAPRKKGAGAEHLVFTTTGTTPVSGWSRVKRRLDAAMRTTASTEGRCFQPFRLHDLRRTAVTGMGELGIAPHVIELVVNHVSGHRAGVAGNYNRSELLPERKVALQRWAEHLSGLMTGSPDNVIALHRGGAA